MNHTHAFMALLGGVLLLAGTTPAQARPARTPIIIPAPSPMAAPATGYRPYVPALRPIGADPRSWTPSWLPQPTPPIGSDPRTWTPWWLPQPQPYPGPYPYGYGYPYAYPYGGYDPVPPSYDDLNRGLIVPGQRR